MCGRATLSTSPDELRQVFGLGETPTLTARYNIAPSQPIAVIRASAAPASGARRVELLRWGLVPSWAKDAKIGAKMINARVESLTTRPAFRDALEHRRALVLVDGFYEWEKRGAVRQPFFVHRADGKPFALAGLWDRWTSPSGGGNGTGEVIESCAIVTCPAAPPCDRLHDRMPLVVPPPLWSLWLDASIVDARTLEPALQRAAVTDDALVLREVSTRVNRPDVDDATCIEPAAPQTPGLFDRYQR